MKRAIRGATIVNYMRFDARDKESVEELKELLEDCYVNRVNLFGRPVLTVQHNESLITKEERTLIVNDGDYIIKHMYGALEVVSEQVFNREFTKNMRRDMNHWTLTGDHIWDEYSGLTVAAQMHKVLMDDITKREGLQWKTTDQ